MSRKLVLVTLVLFGAFVLAACAPQATPAPEPMPEAAMEGGMDMSSMAEAPSIPAGMAYIDGQEMRFVHTEASDPDVAKLLSDMMSSPVIHVAALAEAPEAMLAQVYVFKNGVAGMGPLGYQPDVFDNPPGSPGYSPLRRIVFATWTDESKARELKALSEVIAAEAAGELALETSGVVVNMPFIAWPGGSR